MIRKENFLLLKSWFNNYVKSFHSDDYEFQRNIDLKEEHTLNVCKEINDIGESLYLSEENLRLSETIALFHDIGRFEQYKRYNTYSDKISENHAELGIKVLKENHVLDKINLHAQNIIFKAISYHNLAKLPEKEIEEHLFYSKLIRDADKVDIYRVVTNYYSHRKEEKNTAIELELPDIDEISDEVYADIMAEKIVNIENVKTLNDFKLLQMSWAYDVNFIRTFRIIYERHYIEKIYNELPHNIKVKEIYSKIMTFVNSRCFYVEEIPKHIKI